MDIVRVWAPMDINTSVERGTVRTESSVNDRETHTTQTDVNTELPRAPDRESVSFEKITWVMEVRPKITIRRPVLRCHTVKAF